MRAARSMSSARIRAQPPPPRALPTVLTAESGAGARASAVRTGFAGPLGRDLGRGRRRGLVVGQVVTAMRTHAVVEPVHERETGRNVRLLDLVGRHAVEVFDERPQAVAV